MKFIAEPGKVYLLVKPKTATSTKSPVWRVRIIDLHSNALANVMYIDPPNTGRTCVVSTDSLVTDEVGKQYFFQGQKPAFK